VDIILDSLIWNRCTDGICVGKEQKMTTLAKIDTSTGNWITISKAVQEADLVLFKKKEEKKRKQMLWKCGRSRK
jgi:hypothetical protein